MSSRERGILLWAIVQGKDTVRGRCFRCSGRSGKADHVCRVDPFVMILLMAELGSASRRGRDGTTGLRICTTCQAYLEVVAEPPTVQVTKPIDLERYAQKQIE